MAGAISSLLLPHEPAPESVMPLKEQYNNFVVSHIIVFYQTNLSEPFGTVLPGVPCLNHQLFFIYLKNLHVLQAC
jgi:hypothetical protein